MDSKRAFLFSITLIALGVSFNTTMKDSMGSLGTVFIALGGFFLIVAMSKRQKEKEKE